MVKTRLEVLEKMHDDVLEAILFKEAECDLIQGRIIIINGIDKDAEARRAAYNEALTQTKVQLKGQQTMLEKIERMIEEEKKGVKKDVISTNRPDTILRVK